MSFYWFNVADQARCQAAPAPAGSASLSSSTLFAWPSLIGTAVTPILRVAKPSATAVVTDTRACVHPVGLLDSLDALLRCLGWRSLCRGSAWRNGRSLLCDEIVDRDVLVDEPEPDIGLSAEFARSVKCLCGVFRSVHEKSKTWLPFRGRRILQSLLDTSEVVSDMIYFYGVFIREDVDTPGRVFHLHFASCHLAVEGHVPIAFGVGLAVGDRR